jgi:hypothetical protein
LGRLACLVAGILALGGVEAGAQGASAQAGAPPADACTRWKDRAIVFTRPFRKEGHAFFVSIRSLSARGDTNEAPMQSPAVLCEDDRMMGPAHSQHEDIRQKGGGRFSHWGELVLFSTTDNSSPFTNGRTYSIIMPPEG